MTEEATPKGQKTAPYCTVCGEEAITYTVRTTQGLEIRCSLCGLPLEVRSSGSAHPSRA